MLSMCEGQAWELICNKRETEITSIFTAFADLFTDLYGKVMQQTFLIFMNNIFPTRYTQHT